MPVSAQVPLGFGIVESHCDGAFHGSKIKKGDTVIYHMESESDLTQRPIALGHANKLLLSPWMVMGILTNQITINNIRMAGINNEIPTVKIDYRDVQMIGPKVAVRLDKEEMVTEGGIHKIITHRRDKGVVWGTLMSWGPEVQEIVPGAELKKGARIAISSNHTGGFVPNAKDSRTIMCNVSDVVMLGEDKALFGPWLEVEPILIDWKDSGDGFVESPGGIQKAVESLWEVASPYVRVVRKGIYGTDRLPHVTHHNKDVINQVSKGDCLYCPTIIMPDPGGRVKINPTAFMLENGSLLMGAWMVDAIVDEKEFM
jgi:co-chaperonin GroES (HSP10)